MMKLCKIQYIEMKLFGPLSGGGGGVIGKDRAGVVSCHELVQR